MTRLKSFVLLIVIPIFTLVCSLLAFFVFAPFFSARAGDRLIRVWAKTLCWLAGIRIHVLGRANMKLDGVILISNHLSHFDIPVLYTCLPPHFRMAAKDELFNIPIFGLALKAFGFFKVARESPNSSKGTLQAMTQKFGRGENVWMAPEGTRQEKPELGDFKMGAFFLALRAKVPIVPIVIYGTQKVLPKGSLWISPKNWTTDVYVNICPMVTVADWDLDRRHSLRDHVHGIMNGALKVLSSCHSGLSK